MRRPVTAAVLIAFAFGLGNWPAWAQQDNTPPQAQTDPEEKPAGDSATNTLVPYGVNPPVPDAATPQPTDSVRPETTGQSIPVPQGNFTSGKSDPAAPENPNETSAGDPK